MDVVGGSTCCQQWKPFVLRDAAEICPELRLTIKRYEVSAVFGAEYAMDQIVCVRVSHGAVPTGLLLPCNRIPSAKALG